MKFGLGIIVFRPDFEKILLIFRFCRQLGSDVRRMYRGTLFALVKNRVR